MSFFVLEMEIILKLFLKYHKNAVTPAEKGYTMDRIGVQEERRDHFDGTGEEGRRTSGTKSFGKPAVWLKF